MLYPVFHDGNLAMFTATRCHWGDVGGMTPGSLSGRVKEIYQEGMRIEPTRICERGRMNEAFLDLLFNNMRIRHERRGDFNSMLGTSRRKNFRNLTEPQTGLGPLRPPRGEGAPF